MKLSHFLEIEDKLMSEVTFPIQDQGNCTRWVTTNQINMSQPGHNSHQSARPASNHPKLSDWMYFCGHVWLPRLTRGMQEMVD
jgi:hypothetical protein